MSDAQRHASILILGDNEIAREGLKRLLIEGGFEAECRPLDEAPNLDEVRIPSGQVILVDAQSTAEAMAACAAIRPRLPHARIVLIADASDVKTAHAAFSVGVDGYLDRQLSYLPMMLKLELVALGEKVLPTACVNDIASRPASRTGGRSVDASLGNDLSEWDLDILDCLAHGDQNKTIGQKLGITEATVKVQVKAILRKLNLSNRTQAAIWVVSNVRFRERTTQGSLAAF